MNFFADCSSRVFPGCVKLTCRVQWDRVPLGAVPSCSAVTPKRSLVHELLLSLYSVTLELVEGTE